MVCIAGEDQARVALQTCQRVFDARSWDYRGVVKKARRVNKPLNIGSDIYRQVLHYTLQT